MLKKILFIILIFAHQTAFAMKPTADDFLPKSNQNNKKGKDLTQLIRDGIKCELLKKGSLDEYADQSQKKEVRQSLKAGEENDTFATDEDIELNHARPDFFTTKSDFFSEETSLLECNEGSLQRCIKGIDSFLDKTANDSSELYGIGMQLTGVLMQRSIEANLTESDRSVIQRLTDNKERESQPYNEATLRLYRFVQVLACCEKQSKGILDKPLPEKRNARASEDLHYEREHYHAHKRDALSEQNLSLSYPLYCSMFLVNLCLLESEQAQSKEIKSVIQTMVTSFPTTSVLFVIKNDLLITYMEMLLNNETFDKYRSSCGLDFGVWARYAYDHRDQVDQKSKLYWLMDRSPSAFGLSSPQLTRSDGGFGSLPSSPSLSKASPPTTRRGNDLLNSLKKSLKIEPKRISSSGSVLQLPRASGSKSPKSPRSPRSPKKDSTSPRSSLTESLGNVISSLTRSSESLRVPKFSPPSSRSPSPSRRKKNDATPVPSSPPEQNEVTPAAATGLRTAGRFALEKSQGAEESDE